MAKAARYDGLADWYDENLRGFTLASADVVGRMLGRGPGRCLDLGCGGGLHFDGLLELGWSIIGADLSEDQLRVARGRAADEVELVCTDAADLPFADASFDAVASIFLHTDAEDYAAIVREAARVLRPGGHFVHVGLHPCFVGPFSRYQGPDEPPLLFPGYRETGWTYDAPGLGKGLRRVVGTSHVPLAQLLNAVLAAGLTFERFEEPGETDFPHVLGIAAIR